MLEYLNSITDKVFRDISFLFFPPIFLDNRTRKWGPSGGAFFSAGARKESYFC